MIRENYEAIDDGQQEYEVHKVLHRWLQKNEFAHWPPFVKFYFLQQLASNEADPRRGEDWRRWIIL